MPNLTHTSEQRLSTRAHASPVPDAQTCTALVKISQRLVDQVIQLLETSVTRDDQLAFQSDLIPGSSIGKHLRHTLDHFRLLLQSLDHDDGDSSPLPLCYDTRSRNVTSETSVSAALQSFQTLQTQLKRAESVPSGRRIKLEAVTPTVVEVESTFGRELWFTALHATHHLALLRVIVVGELQLDLDPAFGVAPSTLVSKKQGKGKGKGDNKDKKRRSSDSHQGSSDRPKL